MINLVTHLRQSSKTLSAIALASSTAAALFCTNAWALQNIEVTPDGMTTARISAHEATRIRIDGQPITQVHGSGVQDAKSNPAGSLIVQTLDARGEVSVIPAQGAIDKPVSIFVDTAKATYTLVLIPSDTPSETIVLRDRSRGAAGSNFTNDAGPSTKRTAGYYREIKRLVLTLEGTEESPDLAQKETNEVVGLWPEARFIQTKRLNGISGNASLRGERYTLTNISGKSMRIDERELYAADVVAVSIEKADLLPQETTAVYIVKDSGHVR